MNIDNLKCFILVAENLSFARAAEALYISQPAVTKQINALEKELGVTLLIRSTRHVELTPAGMSFYKDAKDIVLKTQIAVNRVQKQNNITDTLRLGLSNPAALFYAAPILKSFHARRPDIRTHIEVHSYKIVLNLFLEDKLDVLFYYKEDMTSKSGIRFLELAQDTLSCLMPANHPLAQKASVSIEDMADEPVIACNPLNAPLSIAAFQQQLSEHYPAGNIIYCDTVEIAHCMVAAGMGISVIPGLLSLNSPEFAAVPLKGQPPLSYGLLYVKRNTNAALEPFLQLLEQT